MTALALPENAAVTLGIEGFLVAGVLILLALIVSDQIAERRARELTRRRLSNSRPAAADSTAAGRGHHERTSA